MCIKGKIEQKEQQRVIMKMSAKESVVSWNLNNIFVNTLSYNKCGCYN